MNEVWKQIKGYEGAYEVSSTGRVRGMDRTDARGNRRRSRVKKQVIHLGYPAVSLYKNGSSRTIKVHRLVAENFLPHDHNKGHVNHINGVKTDNRVCNLEWCTPKENIHHAYRTGLIQATGRPKAMNQTQVRIAKRCREIGMSYQNIGDCMGLTFGTVCRAIKDPNYLSSAKAESLAFEDKIRHNQT
jgi:hypothetical protein